MAEPISLNELLVHMFNDILKIEEKVLIQGEYSDISIIDLHIIDAISFDSSRNMSSVAKDVGVTVGTLTIAINNLVKKGYVKRIRSSKDRRVVLISLVPKGQKAYLHHREFHETMIKELYNLLSAQETEILTKTLNIIDHYFRKQYSTTPK